MISQCWIQLDHSTDSDVWIVINHSRWWSQTWSLRAGSAQSIIDQHQTTSTPLSSMWKTTIFCIRFTIIDHQYQPMFAINQHWKPHGSTINNHHQPWLLATPYDEPFLTIIHHMHPPLLVVVGYSTLLLAITCYIIPILSHWSTFIPVINHY